MDEISLDLHLYVLYIDAFFRDLNSLLGCFRLFPRLLTFRSGQFPDQMKNLLRVVGSDRGSGLLPLQHNLNELGLFLSVGIEREPIIEVLPANTPTVGHSFRGLQEQVLDIGPEDGLGCGEGKIVLVNDDGISVNGNLTVLVERLH